MHSALYTCRVWHARTQPVSHRFAAKMVWFYLDLDELPALAKGLRLFSAERPNWFSFYGSDHLPADHGAAADLKSRALAHFAAAFPGAAATRVRVMSHPRVAGYVFNPVSFFFFFDAAERCLGALAEVRNTFGEVKIYAVPMTAAGAPEVRSPKLFYVSPFVALDADFHFALDLPGETFRFKVDSKINGQAVVKTGARGTRLPITDGSLLRAALRFPLQTLQVITLIHWHALRLYLKRVPYLRKAADPELQTGMLNQGCVKEERGLEVQLQGGPR